MKGMTEETADELDRILSSLQEHSKQTAGVSEMFRKSFIEYYTALYKSLLINETEKFAKCYIRLIGASFLTRWYWTRKVSRSKLILEKLQQGLNKITELK